MESNNDCFFDTINTNVICANVYKIKYMAILSYCYIVLKPYNYIAI